MRGSLPADGNGLNPWSLSRRALGLLGAGMGRVLGLGSGRERLADAMANRHCIPALGHDAGKGGNAEDLEHVADFSTFMLSIFGTFLTRSGVVSSVHAFAQSSIGDWFVSSLAIIFATCLFFYVKNRSHLRSERKLESLTSSESSFLFNNLLLLVACFTVLWGTLFPVLSEWVQGTKVTVGPPFFNRVNVPVALLLLLLTAVGPLLAWRRTSVESLKRNFLWPAIGAVGTGVLLVALGTRPWKDVSYFYSLMTIMLSVLVALTVISEFVRGGRVIGRHTGQNLFASMVQLAHRNTRRYGDTSFTSA
jgi:cytochrome c-type biogenesis protein CcmF